MMEMMTESPTIAELPVDRVEDAVAFASQSWGCEVERASVRHAMSLVATDGEQNLLGAAIACEVDEGRVDLYVGHAEGAAELDLSRRLADKALHKVHARGVHRCRIVPCGPADVREFWQQVNWLDHAFPQKQRA